jgi:hypothetical protein
MHGQRGGPLKIKRIHHEDLEKAQQSALAEAVCTASAIIPVSSMEVYPKHTIIIGRIGIDAVEESDEPDATRTILRAKKIGNFHTHFDSLNPDSDILGYLVIQRPLTIKGENIQIDIDNMNVAIEIPINSEKDIRKRYGPKCCIRCNIVIPYRRLAALSNAQLCINCKKTIEGKRS